MKKRFESVKLPDTLKTPAVSVRKLAGTVKLADVTSTMLFPPAPVLLIVIWLKSVVAPLPLTVWFALPLKVTFITPLLFVASNVPSFVRLPPSDSEWLRSHYRGCLSEASRRSLIVTSPATVSVRAVASLPTISVPFTVRLSRPPLAGAELSRVMM